MMSDESPSTGTAASEGYAPVRFRKMPVEIEAVFFNGTVECASAIIDWILAGGHTARWHDDPFIAIDTLEGTMRAVPGDYVIRGVQGEFYPCKPDIFNATYEAATDG